MISEAILQIIHDNPRNTRRVFSACIRVAITTSFNLCAFVLVVIAWGQLASCSSYSQMTQHKVMNQSPANMAKPSALVVCPDYVIVDHGDFRGEPLSEMSFNAPAANYEIPPLQRYPLVGTDEGVELYLTRLIENEGRLGIELGSWGILLHESISPWHGATIFFIVHFENLSTESLILYPPRDLEFYWNSMLRIDLWWEEEEIFLPEYYQQSGMLNQLPRSLDDFVVINPGETIEYRYYLPLGYVEETTSSYRNKLPPGKYTVQLVLNTTVDGFMDRVIDIEGLDAFYSEDDPIDRLLSIDLNAWVGEVRSNTIEIEIPEQIELEACLTALGYQDLQDISIVVP